jgi:L-asparaginase II
MTGLVEVTRGALVESKHIVHVVVAHADRGVIASCGDAHYVSFVRSAIKMFQALPLVEDNAVAALGLTSEELALCTASHNGEPFHVAAALRILHKAGVHDDALACGAHAPMFPPAAAALLMAGDKARRIHNNCSGKHAGMLALATHHKWPRDDYHLLPHPVQARVLATVAEWSGVPGHAITVAVDGCGLPTFALPLDAVALACARFAAAAASPSPAATIVDAMSAHPEYVAGTGRLCTALMRTARSQRLFAKVGAEGYYCAGVPDMRIGIALKVEDGAKRASEPALLATLRAIDALTADDLQSLREFAHPTILNTRGAVVGEVRTRLPL